MKILLVHPPMYPVNHEFYNMLAQKVKLVVYQICENPVHHTSWTSDVVRQGKVYYKLKIFSYGSITAMKTLNPLFLLGIIREKPDIVMSIAFWLPSLYIAYLRKVSNFKFVILTNAIPQTEINISLSKKIVRKLIGKNIDLFIAASDLTIEYLKSFFPKKQITLSIQTINVLKWKKNLELLNDKESLRKNFNISADKKVMLGIGNYTEKKNWKSVIRLMPRLDNILFILIGYGEQKEEYIEMIEELEINEKVFILGRKNGAELLEYYKASDFLIFPSSYDQFGFVVPEALSSGLPVICTKNAGSVSLITEGVNGFIINPFDYNEDVIVKMLLDLPKLQENTDKSISKLTLENRVDEFINIFTRINKVNI